MADSATTSYPRTRTSPLGGRPDAPRRKRKPSTYVFWALLIVFVIVDAVPIYWIVISAFTSQEELFSGGPLYFPAHLSVANFISVANAVPLGRQVLNSLVLSVVPTVITLVLSIIGGYAFARIKFPGSAALFAGLLISGFLPTVGTVIPLFQLFNRFGLIDSETGLIILYVGLIIPLTVWFMAVFIRQIPVELEEAAVMDGCGTWGILRYVVFPLLRPAVATFFVIDVILSWNQFIIPVIFTRSPSKSPLAVGLIQASESAQYHQIAWGNQAAFALLMIAPVFVLALVFQRQIVNGVMGGALKG